MFSIYNETATPWKLETLDGGENVSRFSKRKAVPQGVAVREQGPQAQTINILAYTAVIGDVAETSNLLKEAVELQGRVQHFSTAPTSLIFNKKAFRPFVSENPDKIKDILFGSINLNGRKIVGLDSPDTFMVEFYIFYGELSFITAFNEVGAKFIVTLMEEDSRKLITYTFVRTAEGGIALDVTDNETLPIDEPYELVEFRRFRPTRPTHTILVHPNDRKLLESLVDPRYHNIVDITRDTFTEVCSDLKHENYRAVTLFVNYAYNEDRNYDKSKSYIYTKKELTKEFKTVFIYHNDKRTFKLKF